jgi:hypothetical protein
MIITYFWGSNPYIIFNIVVELTEEAQYVENTPGN